ncbi:hypothetical protein K501DRAFT_332943 [Backusella circina FSU 941]|nr:hypothetical protein K501DRAFT_332943 [Backusella circina FSU 941]
MNKLPVEILNQIFVLLHPRHKVECMTVCRHWAETIKESVLFHTIRICSLGQMNQLMKKVRQEPLQGAKVERLLLDLKPSDKFRMNIIPLLFPNIRVFIALNIDPKTDFNDMRAADRLTPHPWYQRIEHIAEYANSMHSYYILTSGPCLNLTKLSIQWDDSKCTKSLVDLLENAPALTTLSVTGSNLTLLDLEVLHRNVPLLKSLGVYDSQMECEVFPYDCEPAIHITHVDFTSIRVDTSREEVSLLLYFRKKYPNLVDFSYSLVVFDDFEFESEEGYHEGFLPLMESLGTQLTAFKFGLTVESVFPFDLLDEAGIKLKKLTLGLIIEEPALDELVQSCQPLYIQTLVTHYILDYSNLKWINEFMNLRELYMAQPFTTEDLIDKTLDLDELLGVLGHKLRVLSVRGVVLTFNLMKIRKYRLEEFSLDMTCLSPQLDTFISQSFPELRSLSLKTWNWCNEAFILPNINLSYLEISDRRLKDADKILVITLNKNERRWYSAKQKYDTKYTKRHFNYNDAPMYPAISSFAFDKHKGRPYITFVCNSLHTLFIMNSVE